EAAGSAPRASRPGTSASREDEACRETEQTERLDQSDTDEHVGPQRAGQLGLPGDRLLGLTDEDTDTDTGADGGETVTDGVEVAGEFERSLHKGLLPSCV